MIGAKLADRFGWKIGDKIPLKVPGYFGGGSWDFYVRAIYHGTRDNDDETQFWMRHDYLYEKAPHFWKGIVGWYIVRVSNPDQALAVAKAIDAEFANSASETRTQTESAFAAAMVKQMGNIEFLHHAIGGVVFFTLLLVTGNTMAIAVRERTNELATLKAIGSRSSSCSGWCSRSRCSSRRLAGAGLWLARGITQQDMTNGLILLYLPVRRWCGAAIAMVTGLMAGVIPAVKRCGSTSPPRSGGCRCGGPPRRQPAERDAALARRRWRSSVSQARWRCSSPCWRWRAGSRPRSFRPACRRTRSCSSRALIPR